MTDLRRSAIRARRSRDRMVCALALGGCAAMLAAGCNTVPEQINGMIAKRLPGMLGPADHYDVHTSGSFFELLRGKLAEARIHGDNVALTPMLHVRSFDADAVDIHANTRTDAITGIGVTTFHLVMDQGDLDNYMLSARPDDYRRGARIILRPRSIFYSDDVSTFGLRTPFSVNGTLRPHQGRADQLDFVAVSGAFAHIGIPRPILRAAVNRQNPVVNLARMTYPVSISSTRVISSTLVVDGSADLSSLIGKNAATAAPPRSHG